ncbi:MAG: UDP-N-acetylmuramate--L-alanine ligase, partial [Actinomycetota bacterium]
MTAGLSVVIAGGGTSGHVLPAIAIAEMLEERGVPAANIHIVGTARGIDALLLGETEYAFTLLPVTGLKRSLHPSAVLSNIAMALRMVKAKRRAAALLRSLEANVVVSVGGYGSVAPMAAARRLGIRSVVVSYDSRPGLATRRQAVHADVVAVADSTSPLSRAVVTGAPVRRVIRFLDRSSMRSEARVMLRLPEEAFVVGVVGGSLGSALLNDVATAATDDTELDDIFWYHVTGDRYSDNATSRGNHIMVPYQADMASFYAACDVIVCRAGASTIAEIATVGVPAIVVPWAQAAENHQEHNARLLADAGGAVMISEADFTVARLVAELVRMRDDVNLRQRIADRAHVVGEANRRARLADVVIGRTNDPLALVDLSQSRRLHIVGIGGPGMSALARALRGAGHRVSGSDIRETDVTRSLRSEGIRVDIGHSRALVDGCDAVCASTGVPKDNIEMAAARDRGIPALSRAGMLAALCAQASTIAVAGTHGKTTTTSLLATMLGGANGACGFVVGGDAPNLGTNGAWSPSGPFVVEADESDGTHEELPVRAAVITNIDTDHLDHFGTFDGIVASFRRFAERVDGPVVLCADDPLLVALADDLRNGGKEVITYGESEVADVRVHGIVQGSQVLSFSIEVDDVVARHFAGTRRFDVDLRAQGRHNALNATAALILAMIHGATLTDCLAVMSEFSGVGRRFEVRGERNGAELVDDYAHLPTEIRAVLSSARTGAYEGCRVVAVFQPNRYHRIAAMADEYADAFIDADVVFVTDIYASGTPVIEGVTGRLIVDAVLAGHSNADVRWCKERGELIRNVVDELRSGDVCVSFGCGDIETFPSEVMREIDVHTLVEECRKVDLSVQEPMPMGERTTYKTGGNARVGVEVRSTDELLRFARTAARFDVPVVVLGRGSNMLVADTGFDGVCLTLGDFASFVKVAESQSDGVNADQVDVIVGGSTPLPVVARQLSAMGISGFEWSVGVPGTIGGAIRMNAGGHGSDMLANLVDVVVVDLRSARVARVPASDLGLRFRGSDLADHHIVVQVRLRLLTGSA